MATGIKETTEAFDAIEAVKKSWALAKEDDGKVALNDWPVFLPALPALLTAISGADKIPAELLDSDEVEAEQLEDRFALVKNDPNWQKAFKGLVEFSSGVKGIVSKEEEA